MIDPTGVTASDIRTSKAYRESPPPTGDGLIVTCPASVTYEA